MKRIVNGVTYNTDTSTALATSSWEPDEGEIKATLYQTRGGAFYVIEEWSREVWDERERQHETKVTATLEPLSPEKAHEWIMTGKVEIIKNPFDDPPEAEAEAEPGATIYIRVPASLKRSVDEAAKGAKVSGNVWAMRCVEQCLGGFPREMTEIWSIARSLTAPWSSDDALAQDIELDRYKLGKAIEALTEIGDLVESFAKARFGIDDLVKIPGVESVLLDPISNISRRFQPYPS
jgi:hypothetical protein